MRKKDLKLTALVTAKYAARSGLPIEIDIVKIKRPVRTYALVAEFNGQNRRFFFDSPQGWMVYGDGVGGAYQLGALPLAGLGQLAVAMLARYIDLFRSLILPFGDIEKAAAGSVLDMDIREHDEIRDWMVLAVAELGRIANENSGEVGVMARSLLDEQLRMINPAEHSASAATSTPMTGTAVAYFVAGKIGPGFSGRVTLNPDGSFPVSVVDPDDVHGAQQVGVWDLAKTVDGTPTDTYFARAVGPKPDL